MTTARRIRLRQLGDATHERAKVQHRATDQHWQPAAGADGGDEIQRIAAKLAR